MFELVGSILSAVFGVLACLTAKDALGALQQSGYRGATYVKWLRKKENLFLNRLSVLALTLLLATTVVALCFSYAARGVALALSAAVYLLLCVCFLVASRRYALKVRTKRTGRVCRLCVVACVLTAALAVGAFWVLEFFAEKNGAPLYLLLAFAPLALLPIVAPWIYRIANAVTGVFERARNAKFVKRAGQVLNESSVLRIAVVGSYGKTSVKNILNTLLLEKYRVIATPESYNTPIGIAKTVLSPEFDGNEILIAEMGARKRGDIAELCQMVKPNYALFTGVCEQHIATFGDLFAVWAEKSEILRCGAKTVVCGEGLRTFVEREEGVDVLYPCAAENVRLGATSTTCTLRFEDGERLDCTLPLLGNAAVENLALAATLARKLGLSVEEIGRGVEKLQPVPHRLALTEKDGVYILDDGYNCNPIGAREAIAALSRFEKKKYIVTPGIAECGVLEEKTNRELGIALAKADLTKVLLVGETLVGAVKEGYFEGGGDGNALGVFPILQAAVASLQGQLEKGDCVLFMNDLPDVYFS